MKSKKLVDSKNSTYCPQSSVKHWKWYPLEKELHFLTSVLNFSITKIALCVVYDKSYCIQGVKLLCLRSSGIW
jgi:hypothetical protein